MSRYKGRPSKATKIEAAHPHAIWVRVPPLGMTQRLSALDCAAAAIGRHATTVHIHHTADCWVRFGFRAEAHAALFRASAADIAGGLVEPGEPPQASDR